MPAAFSVLEISLFNAPPHVFSFAAPTKPQAIVNAKSNVQVAPVLRKKTVSILRDLLGLCHFCVVILLLQGSLILETEKFNTWKKIRSWTFV